MLHRLKQLRDAKIVWLYLWSFLGGVTGVVCIYFLCLILTTDPYGDFFPKLRAVFVGWPKKSSSSLEEQLQLWSLVQSGTVVPSDQLLSAISGYYASLITVLIGLFALFAFVSVVAIQRISRSQIEESIEEHTQHSVRDYFQRIDFQRQVEAASGILLRDIKSDLSEENEDVADQLQKLIDRITKLEGRIAVLDKAEEVPPAQQVEE